METRDQIILDAEKIRMNDGRIAAVVAEENGDGTRMTYIYDVNGKMINLEYFLLPNESINTISSIFAGAENMERECIDLLGVDIIGVSKGLLLVDSSPMHPLRKNT